MKTGGNDVSTISTSSGPSMGRLTSNPRPVFNLGGGFFMTTQTFWMVYRLIGNTKNKARVPRFRHPTLEAAEVEAKRLADLHPGVPFAILQNVGLAYSAPPAKKQAVS